MPVQQVREMAEQAGFCDSYFIDITEAQAEFKQWYEDYLAGGYASDLNYLYNKELKFSVKTILPEAQSLGIFLYFYRTQETEHAIRKAPYKIARYAWGRDYHIILKNRLKGIAKKFAKARVVTDSSPLAERYFAHLAGAGFIGKNGMLIHKKKGSFFLIAAIAFESPVYRQDVIERPAHDFTFKDCGECQLCIVSCPSGAILEQGIVDSNKCISALTIESDKPYKGKKHNWLFGCDICQTVCPYNKPAVFHDAADFTPSQTALDIANGIIPEKIEQLYGSPLKRPGLDKLKKTLESMREKK